MMPQWVLPACCLSLSYLQSGLIALLLHSPPNYHSVPAPPPEALDPELDAARKNVVNGIEDVVSFSEQGTMVLQIRYGGELITTGEHLPLMMPVMMIDPDYPDPSNPTGREWLHWYQANIDGLVLQKSPSGEATKGPSKGEQVVEYSPPHPPKGTHRLIFLLYAQPQGHQRPSLLHKHLTDSAIDGPATLSLQRMCFNHKSWAERHELKGPLACTYFYVRAGAQEQK